VFVILKDTNNQDNGTCTACSEGAESNTIYQVIKLVRLSRSLSGLTRAVLTAIDSMCDGFTGGNTAET
jgi:hypothetical protein